jgi:hypothetical protein
MSNITVIFKGQPPLHIELYDTTAAQQWKELFIRNYELQFPIFRDMQKYTWEYLKELIPQANTTCGWNFTSDIHTLDDTLDLHKCIEVTLANGYPSVPKTWWHILDELHFALHKIQHGNMTTGTHRGYFLQLEWFNDDIIPLPEDFVFSNTSKFGSIRLQNVYVGHPPLMIFQQQDDAAIFQTCRFHDQIKPGLHIMTSESNYSPSDYNLIDYKNWWHAHAPDFVEYHGWDTIMRYTGYPLIGEVINTDDLRTVYAHPEVLELQEVIY